MAIAMAGCSAATPAATPSPTPATAASSTSPAPAMPRMVGRYVRIADETVRDAPTDSLFRFTDSLKTRVSVIRYPVRDYNRVGADSQAWTARAGESFREVQPVLVRQGVIQSFEVIFSEAKPVTLGARTLTEHSAAVVTRSRGVSMVELQYLYLVRGKFLKIRASVPEDRWETSGIPEFARNLAAHLLGEK